MIPLSPFHRFFVPKESGMWFLCVRSLRNIVIVINVSINGHAARWAPRGMIVLCGMGSIRSSYQSIRRTVIEIFVVLFIRSHPGCTMVSIELRGVIRSQSYGESSSQSSVPSECWRNCVYCATMKSMPSAYSPSASYFSWPLRSRRLSSQSMSTLTPVLFSPPGHDPADYVRLSGREGLSGPRIYCLQVDWPSWWQSKSTDELKLTELTELDQVLWMRSRIGLA
jgi:hypothetical protein